MKRFVFCYLLERHDWEWWEIDQNHMTCKRCNETAMAIIPWW